ncbi:uncharacterized protein LOC113376108 [Ctenocephalides felis]|nr:uncharacterized protein LOC113376108 [Ctenocephalides felis]
MRDEVPGWIASSLKQAEESLNGRLRINDETVIVMRDGEKESMAMLCAAMAKGISLTLDLTWTGWHQAHVMSDQAGVPYYRADISLQPFVRVLDDYLMERSGSDAALIFQDESELNQGLYYLVSTSVLRVIVLDNLDKDSIRSLLNIRPTPSYYAIFATTPNMIKLFKTAVVSDVANRLDRWNLVFMDFKSSQFDYKDFYNISLITLQNQICCKLLHIEGDCTCPEDFKIQRAFLGLLFSVLARSISMLPNGGSELTTVITCDNVETGDDFKNSTRYELLGKVTSEVNDDIGLVMYGDQFTITYEMMWDVSVVNETDDLDPIANWTLTYNLNMLPDKQLISTKRFFRIGTAQAIPWAYRVTNPETGAIVKNPDGTDKWEGYCIDLIEKLSVDMNFDYELVVPKDNSFGVRARDGTWDGLVGDLASGETDMVVASLTMTSEREEVIDFVAPYFEQSGILIVMRKPVRQTSLFKFMTVLRLEVWLSIVGALVFTAIMIWFLDKYSPYSARNNKQAYPYPCRDFTLKESFWFALTSFTPQGGGEAPKSLSARTLVAAYWLFVVLMLATFTANLAAFLTVERMQAPVQSLEQLARQSRINYTVVANSDTHRYFINMKFAEDTLYRVWKEITLNSTSDQTQYRVWDYPIKEQYGHILMAINSSMPVENATVGFLKVNQHEDADFAFIHDSAEIK